MTSKEIIKCLISHDSPPRFGYDFNNGVSDFSWVASRSYINLPPNPYDNWGNYQELKDITGFSGEVRRDIQGNIYGRFNGKTKGECIKGVIEDWDNYKFLIPEFNKKHREYLQKLNLEKSERFVLTSGCSLFSTIRDARLMENALADSVTDPDCVKEFIDRLATNEVEIIKNIANCGIDGIFFGDDWGTQDRTFISPAAFREQYKPYYKKMADAAHEAGMSVFIHSCGYIYEFIDDFIEAGYDVFQFDQPDAYPSEILAEKFGNKAVFHSPVDIQKVLPTGNRDFIESRTLEMCKIFRKAGGSWIAKDYPTYDDIGVKQEWASWARNIIITNSEI